tara:strand:- start:2212 stop:2424 length:213 start_codon:yes stop_codon:yes gene_type:complete
MGDLKEDLLDTAAVLREKIKKLGISPWIAFPLCLFVWPILYLLLAFAFVKLIISGLVVSCLIAFAYNQFK